MADLWEKCTRHMLLWTEDELDSFLAVVQKIGTNIATHPLDHKYHSLKFSNRVVSEKINARVGGVDFMLASGFDVCEGVNEGVSEGVSGGKVYVLRPEGVESIMDAVEWLSETVAVCKGLIQKKKEVAPLTHTTTTVISPYAAACLLQIKLPNNTTVQGGFMASDCVSDVTHFAQHFFREDRQSQVVVRLAHVGGVLPGESSLGELRLLPRATLVATTLTAADRDSSFKQAHVLAVEQEEEKVVYKQKSRQEKKQEHEQRQKHKADILRAFREDHDDAVR